MHFYILFSVKGIFSLFLIQSQIFKIIVFIKIVCILMTDYEHKLILNKAVILIGIIKKKITCDYSYAVKKSSI